MIWQLSAMRELIFSGAVIRRWHSLQAVEVAVRIGAALFGPPLVLLEFLHVLTLLPSGCICNAITDCMLWPAC